MKLTCGVQKPLRESTGNRKNLRIFAQDLADSLRLQNFTPLIQSMPIEKTTPRKTSMQIGLGIIEEEL